jgi:anaerobic selenocysteine-containing dehydrogenase
MAMYALNGLVGATDSVGGVCTGMSSPSSGHPKVDDFLDEIAKAGSKNKKIDQRGTLEFPAISDGKVGGGVVTNNVANGILAGNPYDIKVAIGYFNNFNFSGTEGARWDKALAKIPFFAHITTMASEMSQFADIVLPSAMHHSEQWAPVTQQGQPPRPYLSPAAADQADV